MEKEFGRIRKNENVELVIRADEYNEKLGVTIREFMTSDRYTGFTKNGTRIPVEQWEEFKKIVNSVDLSAATDQVSESAESGSDSVDEQSVE